MKKSTILIVVLTVFSLNFYAQRAKEMTIYKSDQTQIQVKGNFEYENDFIKAVRSENKTFKSENIDKVVSGTNVYVIKNIEGKNYLFQEIVNGTLSLYKGKSNYYLENEKHGLREIPERDITGSKIFNSGTVSLFINNCKSAVNLLSNKASSLTIQNLKEVVKTYNSCNLQEDIQIADKVIEESLRPDGKLQFGLTAGFLHLNTDYSNVLDVDETSIGLITVGAKLYFRTNWLKKNRVDFNFSVDYALGVEQQIESDLYNLQSKTSFVNTMFGVNYVLSDLNSIFKPYFGVSAGFLFDAGSEVNLIANSSGNPSLYYDGKSQIAYNLNVGTTIEAFNQEFDFLIAYQPKLKMPIESSTELVSLDAKYEISGLNFRLTYVF